MSKILGAIMVAFGLTAVAHAVVQPAFAFTPAPEIDPASALGALTLLGGVAAVLRGRRLKKR
jgi:hypothetical protein